MPASTWDKTCAILGEGCGMAILVFGGCLSSCNTENKLLEVSIACGVVFMMVVQIFIHISGAHFNPAVTICACVLKLISIPMSLAYICAQFIGAIIGYGALMLLLPQNMSNGDNVVCLTTANRSLSVAQIFVLEFIATGILVLLCCGLFDPRNANKTDALPITAGLTITVLVLVFGPFNGPSLNTARSFAPALLTGNWEKQWIYWVAPQLSGFIVSFMYKFIFWRPADYTGVKNRDY